jgi:hypothetical protein
MGRHALAFNLDLPAHRHFGLRTAGIGSMALIVIDLHREECLA